MKGNVLTLRSLSARNAWCDKDHVLLHACFQILVDFLDREKPQTIVDYTYDKEHRQAWKELQALSRYWKIERPRAEREKERALSRWSAGRKVKWVPTADGLGWTMVVLKNDKKASACLTRLEIAFDRREDEMLNRLIAIRRYLWC